MRVVELFAGVGGFRLGFEKVNESHKQNIFNIIWANQYEPSTKKQHAAEIYAHRWNLKKTDENSLIFKNEEGDILSNQDINDVESGSIPEHDILCGGFPCQDYSVARTISGEMGIEGEKGKLWTEIRRIIDEQESKPKIIFLENVPRILNSPAKFRGLNFSIIVKDLLDLDYDVEWKVINAADYGMPQKRKRTFILGYHKSLRSNLSILSSLKTREEMSQWLFSPDNSGILSSSFPSSGKLPKMKSIFPNPVDYNWNGKKSPFLNTGYSWKDHKGKLWLWTAKSKPEYSGKYSAIRDIMETNHNPDYEISNKENLRKYRYIKGEQKEFRIRKIDSDFAKSITLNDGRNIWEIYQECTKSYDSKTWEKYYDILLDCKEKGFAYSYAAGAMSFPDSLDKPSRTIVTAEVGKSVSRMRHVIEYKKGKYRRLMPIELERLNQFPDDWTNIDDISDSKRGFLMGNALVIGIVEGIANSIFEKLGDRGE